MHKCCTLNRTVVKGAGQRKQILLEQVDRPRKSSKSCDLQQHLHQLFRHYWEEEKDKDNDNDDGGDDSDGDDDNEEEEEDY